MQRTLTLYPVGASNQHALMQNNRRWDRFKCHEHGLAPTLRMARESSEVKLLQNQDLRPRARVLRGYKSSLERGTRLSDSELQAQHNHGYDENLGGLLNISPPNLN